MSVTQGNNQGLIPRIGEPGELVNRGQGSQALAVMVLRYNSLVGLTEGPRDPKGKEDMFHHGAHVRHAGRGHAQIG